MVVISWYFYIYKYKHIHQQRILSYR